MRELPILFSTPMVQAILEGRKTMTRRVCKDIADCDFKGGLDREPYLGDITLFEKVGLRKWDWVKHKNQWLYKLQNAVDGSKTYLLKCPYGQPGDRLWVRETWASYCDECKSNQGEGYKDATCAYGDCNRYAYKADDDGCPGGKWRPSIHMPKEAARIWLEVTNVRVERLQEITEEEAKAEGIIPSQEAPFTCYRADFEKLWNSLNAKRGYGWDTNPFCWVIEFRKVKP